MPFPTPEMSSDFRLGGIPLPKSGDFRAPEHIRPDILAALQKWAADRRLPGDFLQAVLRGDLVEAVGRADNHNLLTLGAIVSWCYNNLPSQSWGSPDAVAKWERGT